MNDNGLRKIIDAQDVLCRQLEPIQSALKAAEASSSVRRLIEDACRQQNMFRAALGPIEELCRHAKSDQFTGLAAIQREMQELSERINVGFRVPAMDEMRRFLDGLNTSAIMQVAGRFDVLTADIAHSMEAMSVPWLALQDEMRSVGAFAQVQSIGQALRVTPAFDERLTEALRVGLGDWQLKIDWPPEIFADVAARTSFYATCGLDQALTAFPLTAFEQGIDLAGLKVRLPPREDTAGESDEECAAFDRTNQAHRRLLHFEIRIRAFIEARLKAVFGEDWIKHRVPDLIQKNWHKKRQEAQDKGEAVHPLIAYADFTDYLPIIERRDNWEAVFKPFFRRSSFVQESFQRLYPIRICTMHARLITQDDELYLYVETKRILSTIGGMSE
jgi:Swt1-like HEPN